MAGLLVEPREQAGERYVAGKTAGSGEGEGQDREYYLLGWP